MTPTPFTTPPQDNGKVYFAEIKEGVLKHHRDFTPGIPVKVLLWFDKETGTWYISTHGGSRHFTGIYYEHIVWYKED